jgi:hypothetical protein
VGGYARSLLSATRQSRVGTRSQAARSQKQIERVGLATQNQMNAAGKNPDGHASRIGAADSRQFPKRACTPRAIHGAIRRRAA